MRDGVKTHHTPSLLCLVAAVVILISPELLTGLAAADGLNGYLELNYARVNATVKNATDEAFKSQSENLAQRYGLSLDKGLFPTLRLTASGVFEKNSVTTEDTSSSTTTLRPAVDLTFTTPLFGAAAGYSRAELAGSQSPTQVNEDYHAMFMWQPVELPSVNLQVSRANLFDTNRILADTTVDRTTLGVNYQQIKHLNLGYNGSYSVFTDRLNALEVKDFANSGQASYANQFFNNRVYFMNSYNGTLRKSTTTASGSGEIDSQLFPLSALFALSDTPDNGVLEPAPALIDGNLTASTGINIGVTQITGNPALAAPRNIGVDFGSDTEVNRIFIWTDRRLPTAIVDAFSWAVYTSMNNQDWQLWQAASPASFDPFQNRFQLDIPTVKTRYIKVVTRPLTPIDAALAPTFQNPDKIFISEVQCFIRRPAADVEGTSSSNSHAYNLGVRTRLLSAPALFHDLSFSFAKSNPGSSASYYLANNLTLSHRFNEVFAGSARIGRDDSISQDIHKSSYSYSASIKAVPLPTLSHVVSYSGRLESTPLGTSTSNSLTLYNTAELYKGININASGGVSYSTAETGKNNQAANFHFGAGIIPRNDVTINMNYQATNSETSGGELPPTSSFSQRTDLGVAYRPFATLFFVASYGVSSVKDKTDTTMNYGINWSPLPEGDLQFNFAYAESIRVEDNSKQRLLSQSVSWKVTRASTLDFTYALSKNESITSTSDSDIYSVSYKLYL